MKSYQLNTKLWDNTSNKDNFKGLVNTFEETITRFKLDSIKKEFDLELLYTPNHACIWNKIDNIGKKCKILEKNDKLILVGFIGTSIKDITENILEHLYRIEDISLYVE